MPKDTATDATVEALDHLMTIQEQHSTILTHLEQRPVPDVAGLARRLEEVADAVERLQAPARPDRDHRHGWRWRGALLVLGALVGWGVCWSTVRYLPNAMLPPGFTRTAPGSPMKGKY